MGEEGAWGRGGKGSPARPGHGPGAESAHTTLPSADTNIFYHVEGSRQALRVVFHLDSYHFSKLPTRLESGASLRLHTVLFTRGDRRRGTRGWGGARTAGPTRNPTVHPPSQLWRAQRGRRLQGARPWKTCSRRSTHSPWRRPSNTTASSGMPAPVSLPWEAAPAPDSPCLGEGIRYSSRSTYCVPGLYACERISQQPAWKVILTHFSDEES